MDVTIDNLCEQARTAKVVTNQKALRTPVPISNIYPHDARRIAGIMLDRLDELKGVGLSANQLGLSLRICVVNVTRPLWFLNPRIVGVSSNEVKYVESCLSLPKTMKRPILTIRPGGCEVVSDNYTETVTAEGIGNWKSSDEFWGDRNLLEAIALQHEVDHLDGKLIHDVQWKRKPILAEPKPDRNEKVVFLNEATGETQFLKYKKGIPLLANGWVVA